MQYRYFLFKILVFFSFVCFGFAEQPIILQHGGVVRTVKFSPVDSSVIASAGDSNAIKLWDWQNNTATTLRGHTGVINSVAFSPDGTLLASGGDDWTFRLWDVNTHRTVATLKHISDRTQYQVKDVVFSPDGQILATAAQHVKLWNINSQNEIATLQHNKYVLTLAFSPNGQLLAAGDFGGTIRIWDVATQKAVAQLEGDTSGVYTLVFSPDGRTLASAGYHGLIKLWTVSDWTLQGTLENHGTAYSLDFSSNGKALASAAHSKVSLWAVENGEEIASLTGYPGWTYGVDFSPDGRYLASSGDDGTVRVQNIESYLQTLQQREMVRLLYFLPNDRSAQPDIDTKMDTLIKDVQQFYPDQMQNHGFDRKTFAFETNATGNAIVHHVNGKFSNTYYNSGTFEKVLEEIETQFDSSQNIYLIAIDIGSETIDLNWCGQGGLHGSVGGMAIVPASGICFAGDTGVATVAHELGHAFGLKHDFRNNAYMMSYGGNKDQLSHCAAEWLDAHRYFNDSQISFNEPTTIVMQPPIALPSNTIHFRFDVTDNDGLHQAQFVIPTDANDPADGTKLHSCKLLNSEMNQIGFTTTELSVGSSTEIELQVIDTNGFITQKTFPIIQNNIFHVDINNDGMVDDLDLDLVTASLGTNAVQDANPNPDVNKDGFVNSEDLLIIVNVLESEEIIHTVPASIATVQLMPQTVESPEIGEELTFSVNITDGANVSGYQTTVSYDTTALRYVKSAIGDYLPSGAFFITPVSVGNTVTLAASALIGESNGDGTLATITFEVVAVKASTLSLSNVLLTDGASVSTSPQIEAAEITEPPPNLPEDVNGDGVVNVLDLIFVALHYGQTLIDRADVNADGVVNIDDLILVAAAIDATTAAPSVHAHGQAFFTETQLQSWLTKARETGNTSITYQKGIDVLEQLLASLTPIEFALLPNYPNPFNPETWIPYQLAKPSDVTITIYSAYGTIVRTLSIGHQTVGLYQSKGRAAYWDGKNDAGEPIASGVYFYTFSAGKFTATRKMLIRK